MRVLKVLLVTVCAAGLLAAVAGATSISMKLSGEGVVNDSTVKAGTPVSVDIYIENDSLFTGFSFGFTVTSPDIKNVIHVADSGNGLNKGGDIKGFNGWQDASIWNFGGVYAVERDWDGSLPDMIGFGGLCIQQEYSPHDIQKVGCLPRPHLLRPTSLTLGERLRSRSSSRTMSNFRRPANSAGLFFYTG